MQVQELTKSAPLEDLRALARIMASSFPHKFLHVKLDPEAATSMCLAIIQDSLLLNEQNVFGVVRDESSSAIVAFCHLWLPLKKSSNKELESPPTSTKGNVDQFMKSLSWWSRLRVKKLNIILDENEELQSGEAYVKVLAVDGGQRGKGVGKQLLQWADETAKQSRHSFITLHVACDNPAKRLYQRHGYVEDPKRSPNQPMAKRFLRFMVGVNGFDFVVKPL